MTEKDGTPIAVIGAGFSGTMTALHLLRSTSRPILLFDRSGVFARGPAYATADPNHLLNVPACNMGAYPDVPGGFLAWLRSEPALPASLRAIEPRAFAPRAIYGRYLSALLEDAVRHHGSAARLRLVPDGVVDVEPGASGWRLTTASGARHDVWGAVLAFGNLAPPSNEDERIIADPWSVAFEEGLDETAPVAIIGTGLTMVDIVVRLRGSGFRGPLTAISRRGLLPRPHSPEATWPPFAFADEEARSPARLLRRVRAEVARASRSGIPWQAVIDSLRPMTASLWRGLPEARQRGFLEHLRPWWDVHRHRMPPRVADQVAAWVSDGSLSIVAARVLSREIVEDGVVLGLRPRRGGDRIRLHVQRLIEATGGGPSSVRSDMLVRALLAKRIARLDPYGLGLDVGGRLDVLAPDGEPQPRLWALGPIVRGAFWECTAVPDIRRQAVDLSAEIAARRA